MSCKKPNTNCGTQWCQYCSCQECGSKICRASDCYTKFILYADAHKDPRLFVFLLKHGHAEDLATWASRNLLPSQNPYYHVYMQMYSAQRGLSKPY